MSIRKVGIVLSRRFLHDGDDSYRTYSSLNLGEFAIGAESSAQTDVNYRGAVVVAQWAWTMRAP